MSKIKTFLKSPRGKWLLRGIMLAGTGYAFYLGYEKVSSWGGWPLHHIAISYLLLAALVSCLASLGKAYSWRRMFSVRPSILTLMAASGVSATAALLLPGEFCDAVRIWCVKKLDSRQDTGTITLSLGTSGLLDPVAMAPFSILTACLLGISTAFRLGLIGYGLIGFALCAFLLFLPKALKNPKLAQKKLVQFFAKRWPNKSDAMHGFAGSLFAYLLRSVSLVLLLLALGVGVSVSLPTMFVMMLAVQCAGAVAMVVPIAPSATQAGAAGAILASAGITSSTALAFGIASQFLAAAVGAVFLIVLLVHIIRTKNRHKG